MYNVHHLKIIFLGIWDFHCPCLLSLFESQQCGANGKKLTMLNIHRGEAIRMPVNANHHEWHATHKILTNWHEQHVSSSRPCNYSYESLETKRKRIAWNIHRRKGEMTMASEHQFWVWENKKWLQYSHQIFVNDLRRTGKYIFCFCTTDISHILHGCMHS